MPQSPVLAEPVLFSLLFSCSDEQTHPCVVAGLCVRLFPPCAALIRKVKVGSCSCTEDATAHVMGESKYRQNTHCTAVGWAVV